MKFRNAYNYDRDAASVASGLACSDPSRTRQSEKEDADINVIVRRFGVTGQMPVGAKPILYGDFAEVFDFQSAQQALIDARQSFMSLSAEVRDRFNGDPQRFMAYCCDTQDAEKVAQLRKWGVLLPEVVKEPEKVQKVEIVNQPQS